MIKNKKNKTKWLFVGILVLVAGAWAVVNGLAVNNIGRAEAVIKKPLTDAEWATDVKKENFDIKSTPVLEEMLAAHTEKLAEQEIAFQKFIECPECIRYEISQHLKESYGMSGRELTDEVNRQYQERYANAEQDLAKLRESIERMQKELELRAKGYVVVEEKGLDLKDVPEDRIRRIND